MQCEEIKNFCQCGASVLFGLSTDCKSTIITGLFFSVIVGLFTVGALAVHGKIPYAGWIVGGLGISALGISLLGARLKQRIHELVILAILTVTLLIVGILAGMGQVHPQRMGWGCLGATLAFIPLSITTACCFRKES